MRKLYRRGFGRRRRQQPTSGLRSKITKAETVRGESQGYSCMIIFKSLLDGTLRKENNPSPSELGSELIFTQLGELSRAVAHFLMQF